MTVLDGYWKHLEYCGAEPKPGLIEPNWDRSCRELFRAMDKPTLDILRGLSALRVWTENLAAYAVPGLERKSCRELMNALAREGAVYRSDYEIKGCGEIYRFTPSAQTILREEYGEADSALRRHVLGKTGQYFQKKLAGRVCETRKYDRDDITEGLLLLWTDVMARLTEDPWELAEQYERHIASRLAEGMGWPNREITEMFFLRAAEIAALGAVPRAFFEHERGAFLFFGGTPQERAEGFRLLQSACEALSKLENDKGEWRLSASHDFARAMKGMGRWKEAAEQMESYARLCQTLCASSDPRIIDALREAAELMTAVGRLSDSQTLHRELLEIRRETVGDDAEESRNILFNLSRVLEQKGEKEEAASLREKVLAACRKILAHAEAHTEAIDKAALKRLFGAADDACFLLLSAHDEDAAHEVQEMLLKICGRLSDMGELHFPKTETKEDLSSLYELPRRIRKSWALSRENVRDEALAMRQQIIDRRLSLCETEYSDMPADTLQRCVPQGHYNMEISWAIADMEALASDLADAGQREETEALRERIVALHQNVCQGYIEMYGTAYGSCDEDTMRHWEKIIELTRGKGRDEENLELRRYTIIEYRRQNSMHGLGINPLGALRELAAALDRMGRADDAREVREYTFSDWRRKKRDSCDETLKTLEKLADDLCRMERFEEELPIRRAILSVRKVMRGEEDLVVMRDMDTLADLLHETESYGDELPLRETLLSWTEKNCGADARETIYTKMRTAQTLTALQRHGEAANLWRVIAESREQNLGSLHALLARHLAACSLCMDGRAKEALAMQRKTMEIFREDNPQFMEAEREGVPMVAATVFLEAVDVTALCEMLAFMEDWDEGWVQELRKNTLAIFSDMLDCCGGFSPLQEKAVPKNKTGEKPTWRQGYFYPHDETINLLMEMQDKLKEAGHRKEALDAHRRWGNLYMMGFALAGAGLMDGEEKSESLHRAWELGTAEWGREDVQAVIPYEEDW